MVIIDRMKIMRFKVIEIKKSIIYIIDNKFIIMNIMNQKNTSQVFGLNL